MTNYVIVSSAFIILIFMVLLLSNVIHFSSQKPAKKNTSMLNPLIKASEDERQSQIEQDRIIGQLRPDENYITPTNFEVGVIKGEPFKASNNCLPDTLYPINGLGPDYGSKMPSDPSNCRCLQFIQPP